ncbi:MAG: hypothetical protein WCL70_02635 [Paludibacter sp.]
MRQVIFYMSDIQRFACGRAGKSETGKNRGEKIVKNGRVLSSWFMKNKELVNYLSSDKL